MCVWVDLRKMDYHNDNAGNIFEGTLGPYRGNYPGYYNDHPAIFDHESEAPNRLAGLLSGMLTPEKGTWGTLWSESYDQRKTRFVVYGDPKTGKASSWTLYEWAPTGRKQPNTNIEFYDWVRVPNANSAIKKYAVHKAVNLFWKRMAEQFGGDK